MHRNFNVDSTSTPLSVTSFRVPARAGTDGESRNLVAEGFSLRFVTFEGIMQVTQPQGCGYKIAQFR